MTSRPSSPSWPARWRHDAFYADVFRSREYFYYGPDDEELGPDRDDLTGLRLAEEGYRQIGPDARGRIWSEVLGAYVGRWDGVWDDQERRWIRLYDARGRLIPTGEEAERRRAEVAESRAAAAEAEVARLRRRLESKST